MDDKVFFFSTDHCQEFENEDDYVPVSSMDSKQITKEFCERRGYVEIPNPDPEYQG